MRAWKRHRGRLACAACVMVIVLCQAAQAGIASYDPAGVDVAPGAMAASFGAKVAELDAKAYGFNFLYMGGGVDDPFHGHRNLNVITEVFVADHPVAVGGVTLQPGDLTFAYTLDYSHLDGLLPDSTVQDFQILRTLLGFNPPTENPGPGMAVNAILGGAYNTNAAYGDGDGTPPLEAYPDGMICESVDLSVLVVDMLEYSWGTVQVTPGSKAMVLLFTSPADIWQVGWGSQNGQTVADPAAREAIGTTAEGGSTVGGGQSIPDSIPVLIPVVPEPATLALLALGGAALLRRRS